MPSVWYGINAVIVEKMALATALLAPFMQQCRRCTRMSSECMLPSQQAALCGHHPLAILQVIEYC